MWYVDICLFKWLDLYPSIKFDLNCPECSVKRKDPKPFVRKDFAGVRFDICECGCRGEMVVVSKSKDGNKKYLKLLSQVF